MNLVFIGDVFGSPGREFLALCLPGIIEKYSADFVLVNCENAAGGAGLTPDVAEEMFGLGAMP